MTIYMNQFGQEMTASAFYALQAAKLFNSIGSYAAIRYFQKRTGAPIKIALRLITLARQLLAIDAVDSRLDFTQASNLPAFLRKQAS